MMGQRRVGAIIAVGYGCGLRRSEIANLDLADYDTANGSLMVRAGKGNKERIAYLPGGASAALLTPHDLRRTFAGGLLDAGEDISTVEKMMGHSNVNTTAGYDRRDAKSKKRAAGKLHVPYRGQLVWAGTSWCNTVVHLLTGV